MMEQRWKSSKATGVRQSEAAIPALPTNPSKETEEKSLSVCKRFFWESQNAWFPHPSSPEQSRICSPLSLRICGQSLGRVYHQNTNIYILIKDFPPGARGSAFPYSTSPKIPTAGSASQAESQRAAAEASQRFFSCQFLCFPCFT